MRIFAERSDFRIEYCTHTLNFNLYEKTFTGPYAARDGVRGKRRI
jgi:hypothetical protein